MKRKPQKVCKCGHAKSKHQGYSGTFIVGPSVCMFCWDECLEFKQDNLATIERLAIFNEEKDS
jgi:hypothetical protein